ncbi:Mrp/NBP35 family ATP-binding protein [Blattabacterium cuenoti]|uniref:Iron-sulfur cluster carrier protein n=1 Tax=Blattabacterium cuenoti STAT TaxID=1457030 RepID=A0A224AJ83_9FLAO|nr:Mrp/NBP35 family ATP-binding protein [Blattabacterium cuenoti]BBA17201.1 Mrp/Nbp35 family ATP-binding protein [Blattabacterium cuenoti STAT]
MFYKEIEKALENVIIDNKNIVESGLVKKIDLLNNEIKICLSLPNPAMHIKKNLIKEITRSIRNRNILDTIQIKIEIESNSYKKIKSGIKNIIAIASGKGGVGKSTVATNIAVSLVQMGFHVGLLDADIYGPSIPLMFNIKEESVKLQHQNGMMNPITSYGVKIISIGFFSKYGQAIVWRGPMVTKVLRQFLYETNWGELDFLIVDFPPGTGDIHLSLLQEISLKGVVIVSTSQKIALSDVNRSVGMFRIGSIYVPILGIIENMSYVISKETKKKCYFFGKNGVKNFSKEMNIFFIGEIPMLQTIREYSDLGIPIVLENKKISNLFINITKNMIKQIK